MAAPAPVAREIAVPVGAATGGHAWRAPVLIAFATVVALRLALSLWAAFVLGYFPTTPAQTAAIQKGFADAGSTPQDSGWAASWERQDAVWYERIALHGYAPDGTTAFFPLLPLLMRVAAPLTGGNLATAGILVASLAAVAAFALLYRLAARDTDSTGAGRSVAYLALFPTAFFLYSAYTESLFLALVLGAFWHARQGRWLLVAVLAALAGLTRVQGALLGLPLAAEYLAVTGWRPPARLLARVQGVGLPGQAAARPPLTLPSPLRGRGSHAPPSPRDGAGAGGRGRRLPLAAVAGAGALGTAAFFAYRTYGVADPLSWAARESGQWQQRTTWPGETLLIAVQTAFGGHAPGIDVFDLGVLLLFTALGVAAFRLRPSYGLLAGVILISTWFHVRADFPLVSISRYVLTAFPCFIVLAIWAGRRPRLVHLGIITVWASWLLVWASQAVRGYWAG